MARSLRRKPVYVEYVGGPLCGTLTDKTNFVLADGFLPSELADARDTSGKVVPYVADNVRPLTANGAHRYLYRP